MRSDPMGWEEPLLFGFLLILGSMVGMPNDNNYFEVDSDGVKHYTLTPEITLYDSFDNFTNVIGPTITGCAFTLIDCEYLKRSNNVFFSTLGSTLSHSGTM